jgi:hypothetical protein
MAMAVDQELMDRVVLWAARVLRTDFLTVEVALRDALARRAITEKQLAVWADPKVQSDIERRIQETPIANDQRFARGLLFEALYWSRPSKPPA